VHFIECLLHGVILRGTKLGENRFDGTVLRDVVGLSKLERLLIERSGGKLQRPSAPPR
jgi:hypothetical protein